jgi:transcriptional regulator with XRE-family HTH domain
MRKVFDLKIWRRLREYTQQEMADKLGVSLQMYRRYERNTDNIKYGRLKQIAEILEVNVEDIK